MIEAAKPICENDAFERRDLLWDTLIPPVVQMLLSVRYFRGNGREITPDQWALAGFHPLNCAEASLVHSLADTLDSVAGLVPLLIEAQDWYRWSNFVIGHHGNGIEMAEYRQNNEGLYTWAVDLAERIKENLSSIGTGTGINFGQVEQIAGTNCLCGGPNLEEIQDIAPNIGMVLMETGRVVGSLVHAEIPVAGA